MRKKKSSALVVGAGISGIGAALDLAETGCGVTLIERSGHTGGILSQLDYQFPSNHCGMCKMLPLVDRDAGSQFCLRKGVVHENIEILLATELISLEGEAGNFTATLSQNTGPVDPDRCIGCGRCVEVCPVERPNQFNAGLSLQKAIYLPVPHAIPNTYIIDLSVCTQCNECEKICPTGAISFLEEKRKDFRVLVVDDELIVRDSIKLWLADEGFSVDMAGSGPEALELLGTCTYHLMLLDIKMPGMDGVKVLKKAREDFPELCVILMTAYATVETAVEAMKIGALDYLVKPFDPEAMLPKVIKIYQDLELENELKIEVGAVILCGGTSYFDPGSGKDTFGYNLNPNVFTSLEFERLLSGTGPQQGLNSSSNQRYFTRPSDGKPVQKVAWLQCVGSRDLQIGADFCSSVCCMHAIKEALLAKEKFCTKTGAKLEAAIFYSDMRTFGKSFQQYKDQAETEHKVRFERGRVHSLFPDKSSKDIITRWVDIKGKSHEETFDLVVLSVGQRPALKTAELSKMLGISVNKWGFCETDPLFPTKTNKPGIFIGGSFGGLKDIADSNIFAGAAALEASSTIHILNKEPAIIPKNLPLTRNVLREAPRIQVVICTCSENIIKAEDMSDIIENLESYPAVEKVVLLDRVCTSLGLDELVEITEKNQPNRILVGACMPCVYSWKARQIAHKIRLDPALIEVIDIYSRVMDLPNNSAQETRIIMENSLKMGIAGLRRIDPDPVKGVKIKQKALIVGGGIAGMTAALAIADHGFQVDLVEQKEKLGGNLNWLLRTVEGLATRPLLDETMAKVIKHPCIITHNSSRVITSHGQVGNFTSIIEDMEGKAHTIKHGVIILAAGGTEAPVTSYNYGSSKYIITQKELEQKLAENTIDASKIETIIMIQCVGSREKPRNYCSRICCQAALKHALLLKDKNPAINIFIFYRDIMTYGFAEQYYTRARQSGIIFIPYDIDNKPQVQVRDDALSVFAFEPIIGRQVKINADLVVLAGGIIPTIGQEAASIFGIDLDENQFFKEAESKFRPLDSIKEGIFACGLCLGPRSIPESIASAQAAAQRALRILSHAQMPSGKITAKIHQSLCALCEKCIDACPYGARLLDHELGKIFINPIMCQGCGTCATVCPNSASFLAGYQDQQMFDIIDAALEGILN